LYSCDSDRIQTCNLLIRSQMLYSVEPTEPQEEIFISQIREMVPSRIWVGFLKLLVGWMNRRLNRHIGEEYCLEIAGIAHSAPKEFNRIAPRYTRYLNYHAAHDIGHTLSYMNFVGCTSFCVKGNKTADGGIIMARNFDFYIGDEFTRDKIIAFVRPETGIPFAKITWGGMAGTVSGINLKGLAITVNGAKSRLPKTSAMPITILIRKILQYASTIDEAFEMARNHRIFVSECIMVASASENRCAIIEKTPYTTVLYENHQDILPCTNHFQSDAMKDDPMNLAQMQESASLYRLNRLIELLNAQPQLDAAAAAQVMRDRSGMQGTDIGTGNEKAINQLVAHHSAIFDVTSKRIFINTGPYCLGKYLCYDLNRIFAPEADTESSLHDTDTVIAEDPFLNDGRYEKFMEYKNIIELLKKKSSLKETDQLADRAAELNPEYFLSYSSAAERYEKLKNYKKAMRYCQMALLKEIPTSREKMQIERMLAKCSKKHAS
jgi:isopenicillin-N N-acyltransferase like protein